MTWWYMSFADPDLPEGKQFLGACIVEGATFANAITNSHLQGCNPGGEAAAMELGDEPPAPASWLNRLLSREEAEAGPPGGEGRAEITE